MNNKIDFMIMELGALLENDSESFQKEGLTQKYEEISLMINESKSPYNSLITSIIDDLVLAKEQEDKIETLEGILQNIESTIKVQFY